MNLSDRTVSFLAFSLFNFACLCGGYTARRRGWLDEELSRPLHFHTVVWGWSAAASLSLWQLPLRPENLWLAVILPLVMAAATFAIIPLARRTGLQPKQVGVLAVAAGLSNTGFTLGAYVCYSLLRPAPEALAYSTAYVPVTTAMIVMMAYPTAKHFGQGRNGESWARLVVRNFADLRSLPMYASLAGVALASFGIPYPQFFQEWPVIDVLFYIGGFGGYFGIGLRLRLGDAHAYLPQHALLAAFKFLAMPALAACLIALTQLTPWPISPLPARVILIQSAMPSAILSVMIANLFGLDARLASNLWVWNTAAFVLLVLPPIIWLTA